MAIRSDLHTEKGLATYVAGMNASQNDKARILDHVQGPAILEVGCGSGAVLELLAEAFPDAEIVGLDMAARLLGVAARVPYAGHAGRAIRLVRGDLFDPTTAGRLGGPRFNSIVFCSVLHELYSFGLLEPGKFGARTSEEGGTAAATRALQAARNMLRPGGVLVLRDGVRPESCPVTLRFKNDEIEERFYRFVDDFHCFEMDFDLDPVTRRVTLDSVGAFEFLSKYFYVQNWDVEVREQFGWADLPGLRALLENLGFTVEHATAYTLPYLQQKWDGDVEITDTNGQPTTLCTTMLARARFTGV
jgi:SAM-dependent methyltransferase